jgi:hypothetical protein
MIVMINYDNPMGYSIDYWDSKDKMEVILWFLKIGTI